MIVRFLLYKGILIFLIISSLYGCQHKVYNPNNDTLIDTICNPDKAYFKNQVQPILVSNCAMDGCHSATSAAEGLILDTYENTMATGEITAGKPLRGEFYEQIANNEMPISTSLNESQKKIIKDWITQGALNNECTECDTMNFTFSGSISQLNEINCKGCHSGSSAFGGVLLTSYSDVEKIATSGKFECVLNSSGCATMPPAGSLSTCQKIQIKKWIEAGALND